MPGVPALNTVTSIRRRVSELLGRPIEAHQITYFIKRLKLLPIGRAGRTNVYADDAVDLVRREIERVTEYRTSRPAVGDTD